MLRCVNLWDGAKRYSVANARNPVAARSVRHLVGVRFRLNPQAWRTRTAGVLAAAREVQSQVDAKETNRVEDH